jgi:hypothetical protein
LAKAFAFAREATQGTHHQASARMSTSAWSRLESPSAVSTLFAKIFLVLTSATAHLDSMETLMLCVKVKNFILIKIKCMIMAIISKAFYHTAL